MLRAKSITKNYDCAGSQLSVLKQASFSVAKGEFVSIVGPSGAGKSTLLHILGGLDTPSSGEVFLDDFCLSRLDDGRKALVRNRRFGFVFQFYHLLREFSALENVLMPYLLLKDSLASAGRSRAVQVLDRLGLGARIQHRPSELSGGEQQRVAIARALINEPEILFCDEPTGNLDHRSGEEIRNLLQDLNKSRKMAIVLVTHSLEWAQRADRILNIFDGVVSGA